MAGNSARREGDGVDERAGPGSGPHDLSCSLAIPEQYEQPDFQTARAEILQTCADRGVPMTVHFSDLGLSQEWVERGASLVLYSSDVGSLAGTFRRDFVVLRDGE